MSKTGDDLKAEGIQAVTNSNQTWMQDARMLAPHAVTYGEEIMIEDIRRRLLAAGMDPPESPNAWGPLANVLIKDGVLIQTGEFRKPTDPTSHSSRKAVYRVVRR